MLPGSSIGAYNARAWPKEEEALAASHEGRGTETGKRPALRPGRPEEPPLAELEFTGCKTAPMSYAELLRYEGRLEVWDAAAGTAWMVGEPTSPTHENPSHGLAGLVERIGAVRGSPIKCYGAMDLLVRDERGKPRRVMQADQTVYLYPSRVDLLGSSAMVVGEHPYPDVVLEVDHTTDVRRGKLRLYEAWGFPEVWVEVPDRRAPGGLRSRQPGLTIHLPEGGVYRESPMSRAFPNWRAQAIHDAMNEVEPSAWTHQRLEHQGRTLGARDGTGPDDDPLLRSLREERWAEGLAEGQVEGRAEGRVEGRAKGRAEGRVEARTEMVRQILLSRGIPVSAGFPGSASAFTEAREEVLVATALACGSEPDFHARIARLRNS